MRALSTAFTAAAFLLIPAAHAAGSLPITHGRYPSVATGIAHSITVVDPGNALHGNTGPIQAQLEGALAEWSKYISGQGSLEMEIRIDPTTVGRAEARSVYGQVIGTAADGSQIVEQGAAYELRTGIDPNGAEPDVIVSIDPAYLSQWLWMDPNPMSRTAPVDPMRVDAVSVFMHELAHALGIIGYRNLEDGQAAYPGQWTSKYDLLVQLAPGAWRLGSAGASAVYGQEVPLTRTVLSQNVYHFGNDNELATASVLANDLMNGIAFYTGTRYDISPLDRSVLRDLGLPIR